MPAKAPPAQAQAPATTPMRPEMRGPQSDIDSILSGLKTKTVNIHEQRANTPVESVLVEDVPDSLISISSLKDMQNNNMPKRTSGRRRNTSNKNTISLDI